MEIAGIIFLSLFGLASAIHLAFCFNEQEFLRKVSKPFCVLFLGLAAVFFLPNFPLVYIGAFLGVIGDVFLLYKNHKLCFMVGALFFVAGHICYLIQIIQLLDISIPWFVYLILAIVFVGLIVALLPVKKKLTGAKAGGSNFYFSLLVIMLVFSLIYAFTSRNHVPGALISLGYLMFIASDCILVYTTFVKDMARRDFYIMLTYLLAEFLIIGGFIFI